MIQFPPRSLVHPSVIEAMIAVAADTPPGAFAEIGVYQGGTAWQLHELAKRQGRHLHLFDTFTGIPHQGAHDKHKVGDFGDTNLADVRFCCPKAIFHVGLFPDTLPLYLHRVAFVHCDCDQEASVRSVISNMWHRLVRGGVIWFDDYAQLDGARIAVDDLFPRRALTRTNTGQVYARK